MLIADLGVMASGKKRPPWRSQMPRMTKPCVTGVVYSIWYIIYGTWYMVYWNCRYTVSSYSSCSISSPINRLAHSYPLHLQLLRNLPPIPRPQQAGTPSFGVWVGSTLWPVASGSESVLSWTLRVWSGAVAAWRLLQGQHRHFRVQALGQCPGGSK